MEHIGSREDGLKANKIIIILLIISPCLWESPLCGTLCIPCADNKFGSKKIILNDTTPSGTQRNSISS